MDEIAETRVTNEAGEIVRCPQCQSNSLSRPFTSMKDIAGIMALLICFGFGGYPLYYFIVYKCNECGKEFDRNKIRVDMLPEESTDIPSES